jgi:hypothetical protein
MWVRISSRLNGLIRQRFSPYRSACFVVLITQERVLALGCGRIGLVPVLDQVSLDDPGHDLGRSCSASMSHVPRTDALVVPSLCWLPIASGIVRVWAVRETTRHAACTDQPNVPVDHTRFIMANESLGTYLNDHLAGSVVALELLDHLETDGASTAEASLLAGIHADIAADRQELEAFMAQLGIAVSAPRTATGWLLEKLSEIKLHLDDAGDGALRRLEALETVSLGIAGKQALWHGLAAVAEDMPELGRLDYARLGQRAERQREAVESLRLRAAQEAFGTRP